MKLEMNRAWNDAVRLVRRSREVVLIVAGVFFFLPYLAFTPEANKAEKFLLETLEAQKAPDGQRTAL